MHIRHLSLFSILSLVAVLAGACERGAPAPAPNQHDHAAHQHSAETHAVAGKPVDPVGPSIETGSFRLAVAPVQAAYRIGKVGELEVALEGRGPWHVNQEYPIRIDLEAAPGVTLKKNELGKGDAEELSEQRARFLVAVEPSAAGQHDVTCDVSFAMCTEENCILEKRTVSMRLEVD
ncbi:MAG: hypothetical protein WCE62_20970 [Polyangiales bacterium]